MTRARVTNRMPQFVEKVQRRTEVAMTKMLILGASESSVMTPIDTSNLLNGQYREVQASGGLVRGRVGYVAPYAMAVHDPDNPQNFRRASARKGFLKIGFEQAEPNMRAVLRGAIKT